jgi:hypothetical protein
MATTCPHCGAPIPSAAAAGTAKSAAPAADKRELRVAADGSGDVTSIQEAVKHIADGGLIRVAAGGVYNETISLTRSVTIVGESGSTQPQIQSVGQRLLTVTGATVLLRDLAFRCIDPKPTAEQGTPEDYAGVWCKSGHISAENCKFVCDQGTSLLVDSPNGSANLTSCEVEGGTPGIIVNDGGRVAVNKSQVKAVAKYPVGLVLSNSACAELTEVQLTGTIVSRGSGSLTINGGTGHGGLECIGTSSLKMQNATWQCGRDDGIWLFQAARAEIDACQIEGILCCLGTAKLDVANSRVQVPMAGELPKALALTGEGRTRVVHCEILGNQKSIGVWGQDSHNVHIAHCRIAGHEGAVCIMGQVRATVENCDLRGSSDTFRVEPNCRLQQSGNRM